MTLHLKDPLDIVFNDEDWVYQFTFELTEAEVPVWAASEFVMSFARLGADDPTGFSLSTESGGLVAVAAGQIAIRVAAVDVAELAVGDYEWTLRRIGPDGETPGLIIGRQSIREGISRRAGPVVVGSGAAVNGTAPVLKIIRAPNGVRVVKLPEGPPGSQGPPGPSDADGVTFDDALTGLGATDVQAAITAVWAELIAPHDDFDINDNLGLGLVLGAI